MNVTCNGCGCGCNIIINEETGAISGNGCGYGMGYAKSQLADYKGWRAKFAADNALNYSPDELIDAVSILRDALLSTVADGVSPRIALENALIKIIPASR